MATRDDQRKELLISLYNEVRDVYKKEVNGYLIRNGVINRERLEAFERGFGKSALRLVWNVIANGMGKAIEGFADMPVSILASFLDAFNTVDANIVNFYIDDDGIIRAQKGLGIDSRSIDFLNEANSKQAITFDEMLDDRKDSDVVAKYLRGEATKNDVMLDYFGWHYYQTSSPYNKVNIDGKDYIFNYGQNYFYDKDEYGVWQNSTTMDEQTYNRKMDDFKNNRIYNAAQEMIEYVKHDFTQEITDKVWKNQQFAIDEHWVNKVLSGVTQMLPAFLLTAMGAPALASTYFFGMTYGMSVEEGLNRGLDIQSANSYGFVNALVETGIESIGGYAFGLNKISSGSIWKNILEASVEEGVEELYGGLLNPFVDSLFGLEDDPLSKLTKGETWGEMGLEFLGGAISGGIWGGINLRTQTKVKTKDDAARNFLNLTNENIKNPERAKKKFNQRLDLFIEMANKNVDVNVQDDMVLRKGGMETLADRKAYVQDTMGAFVEYNEKSGKFEKTNKAQQLGQDIRAFQRVKGKNVSINTTTHAINREIYGQEIANTSPTGETIKVATLDQVNNHKNPKVKNVFNLAQKLNTNIVFFDGKVKQNSFQMDGVAYLNINAKNVGVDLLVHEITHNAQKGLYGKKIKADYKAFEKALIENFDSFAKELGYTKQELVEKYQDKVSKANLKNEIVANFVERMFNNEQIVKNMAKQKGIVGALGSLRNMLRVNVKTEQKADLKTLQNRFQNIVNAYQRQEKRQTFAQVLRTILAAQQVEHHELVQITRALLDKTKFTEKHKQKVMDELIKNLTNGYKVSDAQFSLVFDDNFTLPNTSENIALLEVIISVENNVASFVESNSDIFENKALLKAVDVLYQKVFNESLFSYHDKYERASKLLVAALVDTNINQAIYDNLTNQQYNNFLDFYSEKSVLGAIRARFNNEGVSMVVAFYKTLVSLANAQYSIDNNPQGNAVSKILEVFNGLVRKEGDTFVYDVDGGYKEKTGIYTATWGTTLFNLKDHNINLDTHAISIKEKTHEKNKYLIKPNKVVNIDKLTPHQLEIFNELRKMPIDVYVFESNAYGEIVSENARYEGGMLGISLNEIEKSYVNDKRFQAMVLNTIIHEQMHLIYHTDSQVAKKFAAALMDVMFTKDANGNIAPNNEMWKVLAKERGVNGLSLIHI